MTQPCDVHLVAVGGSVRPGNYTAKALALAVDEAAKRADVTVEVFDPADLPARKGDCRRMSPGPCFVARPAGTPARPRRPSRQSR